MSAQPHYTPDDGPDFGESLRADADTLAARGFASNLCAACRRWKEADAACAAIVNTPEGDRVRAESRRMVREALGAQIDTPGGRRQLGRLRSHNPGEWQKPDPLESLASLLPGLEFSFFRF